MVNFNPNIYYSDEASKAQERYQNAKKETDLENFAKLTWQKERHLYEIYRNS